jgi:hypothetical protein
MSMLGDIERAAILMGGGVVVGMVAKHFFTTLLSSERYKKGAAEIGKRRDEAMIELYTRRDISDSDRAVTEASIARIFARQMDDLDQHVARTNKILLLFAGTGGTFGILLLLYNNLERIKELLTHGSLVLLSSPAFAADGARTELSPLIPYVAMAVLGLMGISFLVALGTILVVKDTRENQARIKAADNIVKTFGGFFTGLATTLLH